MPVHTSASRLHSAAASGSSNALAQALLEPNCRCTRSAKKPDNSSANAIDISSCANSCMPASGCR
jgi:hypothetical protein